MSIRLTLLDGEARCSDKFAVSERPHCVGIFESAREPCYVEFFLKLKGAP